MAINPYALPFCPLDLKEDSNPFSVTTCVSSNIWQASHFSRCMSPCVLFRHAHTHQTFESRRHFIPPAFCSFVCLPALPWRKGRWGGLNSLMCFSNSNISLGHTKRAQTQLVAHMQRCPTLWMYKTKNWQSQQHSFSHVCLTVLARPVKSCCAAQWVFDRRSVETAGNGSCLKLEGFLPISTMACVYVLVFLSSLLSFSVFPVLLWLPLCLLPPFCLTCFLSLSLWYFLLSIYFCLPAVLCPASHCRTARRLVQ